MTILQSKKRKESAKKALSPRLSRGARKFGMASEISGRANKMVSFTGTSARAQHNERATISRQTEKMMQTLAKKMISNSDTGSCGLIRIVNAMSMYRSLVDTHAKSLVDMSRGGLGYIGKVFNSFLNPGDTIRRYQLMNAFDRLKKIKGASSVELSEWVQVKEFLAREMDFESDGAKVPDVELIEAAHSNISSRCSPIPYRPNEIDAVEIPPSERQYRQISAYRVPKKISEETEEERDAISKQLEIEQAEREEAARKEEERLEELQRRMEEKEKEEEAKRLASSVMREFTDEEEELVERAMYGGGPGNEVLKQVGSDSVNRNSMRTLQPGQWLNDEVITFFYLMLQKRDEELCRIDPNRKRCHFFNSFFMTKLLNEGHAELDGVYEYKNVKRWSKKVPGKDIFKLDKIFFPINENRMHWVCAVAFMQEKRIQFYDSMGADGMRYLASIFRYIQDEHKDKNKSTLPDADKWQLVTCTDDTPRQGNGFDCGVFTCCFADFIANDCPLVFTQKHVNKCRKRIALSIMQGRAII